MEKGNGEAAGPPVAEAEDGAGGGATQSGESGKPGGTGETPPPTQGSGGSPADQTRERDPWSGTPDIGETKLPDGTTMRRGSGGGFVRGPDANGRELVWEETRDPMSGRTEGRWVDPHTREEQTGTGWGDPNGDWERAWGGTRPESWEGVPRTGSTRVPEGTLERDSSGRYDLHTDSGRYQWNEQQGKWYDWSSGKEAPGFGDPVSDWQRGAEADRYMQGHPELGPENRPTWRPPRGGASQPGGNLQR